MVRQKEKIPRTLDIDELRVKDLMTEDVIMVSVPGTRKDALKMMVTNHISGIPVVKKGTRHLEGVITRKDIFNNPTEEQLALLMKKDPITVSLDNSTRECARLFVSSNIHRLPVVEEGQLVGIITPCDFMKTMELLNISEHVKNYKKQFCHPVHENTPIIIALHTMKINKNYALPVVNTELEVVGIVTDRDLFEKTTIDSDIVESHIGITEDDDSWSWEGIRTFAKMFYNLNKIGIPKGKISDVMVKNVKSLFEENSVSTAAKLMKKNHYDQIPITDVNDKLTGIITTFSILPALLKNC